MTSPADCALLIGLPLEREQFDRDLTAAGALDFSASILRRHGVSVEGAWRLFAPAAAYARTVCDAVELFGVSTVRAATIAELRASFASASVVSMVSHTRLLPLQPDEVRQPAELCRKILAAESLVARGLRSALVDLLGEPPWIDSRFLTGLHRVTSSAIDAINNDPHPTSSSSPPGDVLPNEHLNRLALECLYGEHVEAAGVVELRDGLHGLHAIIEAMPPEWNGVFDLTLCNSSVLAPWIKRSRPRCICAINRRVASLDVRLARYRVTIAALRDNPRPYVETVAEVHRTFLARRNG